MKIAIVTCLWGRREVSTIVLDWYKRYDATLIAMCTQDEDMDLARHSGWIAKWHINVPLSDKFNAGFMEARNHDPDAVMVVGSDNLINDSAMDALIEEFGKGHDYVSLGGTYFYSPELDECRFVRSPSGCGAGRLLSKELLNKHNWQPYASGGEKYIESKMRETVGGAGSIVDVSPGSGRLVVDVKTKRWEDSVEGVNIHSYEKMARNLVAQPFGTEMLYDEFPKLSGLMRTSG